MYAYYSYIWGLRVYLKVEHLLSIRNALGSVLELQIKLYLHQCHVRTLLSLL